MASVIKFKRSLETSIPSSLSNGEPAWTSNGDILYIGAYDGTIIPIAGKRFPGVLTANQALVTNATNMLDKIMFGNTTVNSVANSLAFTLANSTVSFSLVKPTAAQISDGDKFLKADGSWSTVTGGSASPGGANTYIQYNDSGTLNGTAGYTYDQTTNNVFLANTLLIGANIAVNTVRAFIGNTTVNNNINSISAIIADATSTTTQNSSAFAAGANVYLDTVKANFGNTTVNTIANSIIVRVENASAAANLKATGLEVGTTVVNATVALIGGGAQVNSTAFATGTTTVNATAVTVGGGTFANSTTINTTDLNVSGNLVVSGTVVTVDATNLIVQDPLIRLADDQANTASYVDTSDIGFYGTYGNTTQLGFTGLFRDASDAGIYKLFSGQIPSPTTTVDTANVNYAMATFQAYLKSAAFTVNSIAFTVTANSTWAVNMIANTLTLSTPLAGAQGGTGLATYTAEDILVANTTNGFRKLSLVPNKVLQSNGTVLLFDDIDGGVF